MNPLLADCAVDDAGALTVQVYYEGPGAPALPPGGTLLLVPRKPREPGDRLRFPLRPAGRDLAGRPLFAGTRVAAEVPAAATGLYEGRWDAHAAFDGAGPRRLDGRGLLDTRRLIRSTATTPLHVLLPYRTAHDHLTVRVWTRRRHAEAGAVHLGADGRLAVDARLLGDVPTDAPPRLEARCRGRRELVHTVPGAWREGGAPDCRFTLPTPALAESAADAVWDLYVRTGGADAPAARLGRLLDDVHDKRRVFALPSAPVPGTAAVAEPYYTVANDLSVKLRPATAA
ncbi:hypothetical protein WDH52_05815 [Streptomyces sp. TRM70308]|uniref:hypothetical protein n=1 Tax=Streptomyces sp. TRM70308 TaxID=3131932 RepID=UPI003D06FB16